MAPTNKKLVDAGKPAGRLRSDRGRLVSGPALKKDTGKNLAPNYGTAPIVGTYETPRSSSVPDMVNKKFQGMFQGSGSTKPQLDRSPRRGRRTMMGY